MRRVTGSVDIPLTAKGENQARALALKAKAPGIRVYGAPNKRSMDTARRVDPKAQSADFLKPWYLGVHEGKDLATERKAINDRIVNHPDESPGKSTSGKEGESFNSARVRILAGVQKQSDKTALNISSGRVLQIVHAWAANGKPEDKSVDEKEITSERGEFSKPGQLFRLESGGLKQVSNIDKPGQYFAQHGETRWNSEGDK